MRDKTIIRRAVDAIRHISRLFLVNRTGGPVQCRVGKVGTTLRCVSQQLYASERAQRSELSHAGGLTGPEPLRGETMSIELKDCLLNSGAALVLHGERDLVDADLAQLREFSEKRRAAITAVVLSNTHITGECFQHLALLPNLMALYGGGTQIKDDAPFDLLSRTIEILNLDCTEVGDRCILQLMNLPRLRLLSLRQTGITDSGLHLLGAMLSLREYYVNGTIVSDYAKQRLDNAINLDAITFATACYFFLCTIQIRARKLVRFSPY